jgi:capsular exopolysaccharide synthesis family protein
LLDKKINARIAENLEKRQKGEQFRILDPANLPSKPEKPDPLKIMLAGLVVGCGVGFGGAFLFEQSTRVFRRVEEVESQLELSVLATIPDFRTAYEINGVMAALPSPIQQRTGDSTRASASRRSLAEGEVVKSSERKKKLLSTWKEELPHPVGGEQRTAAETVKHELNLVSRWRPASIVAEQFRVAATRLVLAAGSQKSAVVVVSSAVQGEGKSATASNLAYVLAEDVGKKVVVVDCDFKRPVIHLYTGVSSKPGLVEAIYDEEPIDNCLQRCGEATLRVLPISQNPHRPVGLTKVPQIHRILDELRQRFEFIIVDAPPIMPLADMNLLAGMADILVIVVRAGVTTQETVRKAIKALKPMAQTGVILTAYAEENLPQYLRQYYMPQIEGRHR